MVKKQFFLIVLSLKYAIIFVRTESTVLNVRFSGKKIKYCVNADFCMSTVGYIGNAEKKNSSGLYRVPIELPSRSKFFRYDAYSMALRGLYDVMLPS